MRIVWFGFLVATGGPEKAMLRVLDSESKVKVAEREVSVREGSVVFDSLKLRSGQVRRSSANDEKSKYWTLCERHYSMLTFWRVVRRYWFFYFDNILIVTFVIFEVFVVSLVSNETLPSLFRVIMLFWKSRRRLVFLKRKAILYGYIHKTRVMQTCPFRWEKLVDQR